MRYIDDLVCRDKGSERIYVIQDANWNVVALCNISGTVQERITYDAFGKPNWLSASYGVKTTSGYSWDRTFTWQVFGSETGLMLYRNRFYHPGLGRFVTRDPIGYGADEMRLFRYVRNQPCYFVDPTGLVIMFWPKNKQRATRKKKCPELVAAFLDWARTRYVKNGRSTGTYEKARLVVQPLLALHEQTPVAEFGPLALKKVREKMLESGLCRNEINDRVSRIKRIFSWGVENEMVSPETAGALKYVTGLRKGETIARKTDPVTAVADCDIEAILPLLPPTLDDLVTLHRLIGGRPSEACNLRWCDIDQSDAIWIYIPWEHKTEHKNKQRRIAISKSAQKILEKYRHRPEGEFIFSPRETVRLLSLRRRKERKSKVTPSQAERSRKAALRAKKDGPKHADRYTSRAYERAVRRGLTTRYHMINVRTGYIGVSLHCQNNTRQNGSHESHGSTFIIALAKGTTRK